MTDNGYYIIYSLTQYHERFTESHENKSIYFKSCSTDFATKFFTFENELSIHTWEIFQQKTLKIKDYLDGLVVDRKLIHKIHLRKRPCEQSTGFSWLMLTPVSTQMNLWVSFKMRTFIMTYCMFIKVKQKPNLVQLQC